MNVVDKMPLVSITIPSYNHGSYVKACIESIILQDYANIELIIIDDGSTDDSVLKISEMVDRCRARFHRFEFVHRPNKGLCATLNEALEWAQGDYFSVTDSDDLLFPSKTSVLVLEIEGLSKVAGVFGGAEIINTDGSILNVIRPQCFTYEFSDILRRNKMMFSSCMLIRLDLMRLTGGYPKDLYIEDWYMWLKLTEGGDKLKVIAEPLIQYRLHETNISKNVFKMFEARKEILNIFSHHQGVPIIFAMICLELSIELSRTSKRMSLKYIAQAITNSQAILFKPFFWNAVARLLAPVAILNVLAHFKRTFRQR